MNTQEIHEYLCREMPRLIYSSICETLSHRGKFTATQAVDRFRQIIRQKIAALQHLPFTINLNLRDTIAAHWMWTDIGVLSDFFKTCRWRIQGNLSPVEYSLKFQDLAQWVEAAKKLVDVSPDEKNEELFREYLDQVMPQVVRTSIVEAREQFKKLPDRAFNQPNYQKSPKGFLGMFRTCLRRNLIRLDLPEEFEYRFICMICNRHIWKTPGVLKDSPYLGLSHWRKPGFGGKIVSHKRATVDKWLEGSKDLNMNTVIFASRDKLPPVCDPYNTDFRAHWRRKSAGVLTVTDGVERVDPAKIADNLTVTTGKMKALAEKEKRFVSPNVDELARLEIDGRQRELAKMENKPAPVAEIKPVDPFQEDIDNLSETLLDMWENLERSLGYTRDVVDLQDSIYG